MSHLPTLVQPVRHRRRRLAGLTVAGTMLLAGAIATAPTASAATSDLGGVNVNAYCASNVSSGTLAPSVAVNINNRWDGWRCGTRLGLVGVDMNRACAQQYPGGWFSSSAYANHTSTSATSWRCYR